MTHASNLSSADAAIPSSSFVPVSPPAWLPYQEGVAEINGARLYYRDSGGDGIPVFLMHPVTGSALVWSYQQPALVQAGYRVIAYSRRGHFGSSPADPQDGGVPSRDLAALANFFRINRFAIVSSAAGTAIALDFAMDNSDRLMALIVAAGSYLDTDEPEYQNILEHVRVQGLNSMPSFFRELSPSYRAANIEGTQAWEQLEHLALSGNKIGPKPANKINWTTLACIHAPTLFIAGGADLAAPPTMMRLVAERVPNARMVVMPDVGHSPYWEQPDAFNTLVLDFLRQHVRQSK